MSNPVSLYVSSPEECFAALRSIDHDAPEPVKLPNYLEKWGSDAYTAALAEFYESNPDPEAFADTAAERIVKLITWSWIGEERPSDFPPALVGPLLLDMALSPERIAGMGKEIQAFDPHAVARVLYGPAPTYGDVFESEAELRAYLNVWRAAFADALRDGKGLFYRVWV